MQPSNIEVVVSTANGGGSRALELARKVRCLGPACTVVHQLFGGWLEANPKPVPETATEGFRHLVVEQKGLAKSRNLGLETASAELLVPTDDDVDFLPGAFDRISRAFEENPDADLIAFQAVVPGGEPYKRYPSSMRWIGKYSIGSISSIEIVARRQSLLRSGVRWNEEFGLGSKYNGCLENAFLARVARAGLRILYLPIPIVVHPAESSGTKCDLEAARRRGAIFSETYGWIGAGVALYNWAKYMREYQRQAGALRSLGAMLKEWARYRREER